MSRPPKPDAQLAANRLAANRHDHVARFICEELVLGHGHMQISALLKSYEWWCEARNVRGRRLSPVELLDHIAENYGIEAGSVGVQEDGEERFVYAIPYITFKDPSLNRRLKYQLPTTIQPDSIEAQRGPLKPRKPKKPPKPRKPPMTEAERKAKARAFYVANKERLSAARKAWRKANPDKYEAIKRRVNIKRRARRRAQRKETTR